MQKEKIMDIIEKLNSLFEKFETIEIEKTTGGFSLSLKLPLRFASDGENNRIGIIIYGETISELIEEASTIIVCQ